MSYQQNIFLSMYGVLASAIPGEKKARHCERSEAIHRKSLVRSGLLRRMTPRNNGMAPASKKG